MSPADWARMPWSARQRAVQAARRARSTETVAEQARRIHAALGADPDAAAHVQTLHHYTATPRKRTA